MQNTEELINRIKELESQNNELLKWQGSVNKLLEKMLDMLSQQSDVQNEMKTEYESLRQYANINRYRINSLPYEMQDPDYKSFFFKPKILTKEETIRKIVEEHRSITRFGDGEFAAIVRQKRWNFQGVSEVLAYKLKEILTTADDDILIGLHPTFYMNLFDLPDEDADGVRAYMHPMVRRLHAELLDPDKQYANALFHNINSDEDVAALKQIWDKKDCIFVEGIHTGMGVGNDLFNNAGSIERILGPAENAVDRYDDIMKEVLKQPTDKLLLLALGPTATALAYDLHKEGYQAVDIGHVDLIYESFIRKITNLNSVNIPYKYCRVDECIKGRVIEDIDDPEYRNQIVAVIA